MAGDRLSPAKVGRSFPHCRRSFGIPLRLANSGPLTVTLDFRYPAATKWLSLSTNFEFHLTVARNCRQTSNAKRISNGSSARRQKPSCIVVLRSRKYRAHFSLFDNFAGPHHDNAVGDRFHHIEIMADEQA